MGCAGPNGSLTCFSGGRVVFFFRASSVTAMAYSGQWVAFLRTACGRLSDLFSNKVLYSPGNLSKIAGPVDGPGSFDWYSSLSDSSSTMRA